MSENYWFTSDTHYGHANVIKYAKRPFVSVEEMNETMIERWNDVVRPGDKVFHLGDFAFYNEAIATKIAQRLKGQKFLIFGNHDKRLRRDREFLAQWSWARDLEQITVGEQKITLCHYAMRVWNKSHYGAWQLYGHSHGSLPENPYMRQCDVGVDCWDFRPVHFETLRLRMAEKSWEPVDHHGKEGDDD